MHWEKLSKKEINDKVSEALAENTNYISHPILGVPGTYLDEEEFYAGEPFLEEAPYLRTLIANPNHIGCHTLEGAKAQSIFKGTQKIEKNLIRLISEKIFKGKENEQDGYIATGGTEANIEALWIYRNYFRSEFNAKSSEIAVVYSEDTHYSILKGCNLLDIQNIILDVNEENRQIDLPNFKVQINKAKGEGVKYFILIANFATTMFGSIDQIDPLADFLDENKLHYKIHLDGAFGGFIYPFTNENNPYNFSNPHINSISLDGHKMLQTPYGTGIFLIRKGFMKYVTNSEAQYVPGLDYTICGSRSGANAIVIYMILMVYGSEGWKAKMDELIRRTDYLRNKLDLMNIEYFREPHMNIVTIKNKYMKKELGVKYELVADSYKNNPKWWKIVMMPHVKKDFLDQFLEELKEALNKNS